MQVADAVMARTSIRAFLPKPVTQKDLEEILTIARYSPSGGNLQPWHVYGVAEGGMARFRAAFAPEMAAQPLGEATEFDIYPKELKQPYKNRRFKCGEDLYATIGIGREDKTGRLMQLAKNFDFFGAPAALFFAIDRQMGPGQWAHLGMFMQTLALVAQSRGIASCMQEAWATRHGFVRRFFGVPDDLQIYCGMAFGYADPAAPINALRTDRADLSEFCTFAPG